MDWLSGKFVIFSTPLQEPGKYATMKRGKGRREAPDARKMYNEALMVRKVKTFFVLEIPAEVGIYYANTMVVVVGGNGC